MVNEQNISHMVNPLWAIVYLLFLTFYREHLTDDSVIILNFPFCWFVGDGMQILYHSLPVLDFGLQLQVLRLAHRH